MRLHESIQLGTLLLLFRRWQACLFLSLIVHHFLYDAARVAIQVGQLGVLRLNLLCVDLLVALDNGRPPILLIFLGQRDLKDALALVGRLQAPDRVALLHLLMQFSVNHERLTLQTDLQVRLLDINRELLGGGALGNDDVDSDFAQGLLPAVLVGRPAISGIWKLPFRLLLFSLLFSFLLSGAGLSSRVCLC